MELDSPVWSLVKEMQSKVREDPGQGEQDSEISTEMPTERYSSDLV